VTHSISSPSGSTASVRQIVDNGFFVSSRGIPVLNSPQVNVGVEN
jgi:hypothetical protein